MYTNLRLRSQTSLEAVGEAFGDEFSVCLELSAMAHHLHNARALTTPDMQSYVSNASTANLRSREATELDRPFTPPDGDGGNVKVVVRVRKFVRRGRHRVVNGVGSRRQLMCDRAGGAIALSRRDEPSNERNHLASALATTRRSEEQQEAIRGEELHFRQIVLVPRRKRCALCTPARYLRIFWGRVPGS